MDASPERSSDAVTLSNIRSTALLALLERRRALLFALTLGIAVVLRCGALGTAGFSEDEINKVAAVSQYRHLDFSANAEHPMLLKLLMLGSSALSAAWNRAAEAASLPTVSPETAFRLPSAIAGTLTTAVVFAVADIFFGLEIAAWAALFWAADVNAIAINRIGKEDTLLVLLLLVAVWYYERGKQQGRRDPAGAQAWFRRCGAAFGLMTAAKYMPHYFGLHAIYFRAAEPHPGKNRPDKRPFYTWLAGAFLLANFAVLLPGTWRYLLGYLQGAHLHHTGYLFAHRLYTNTVSTSPWGLPPWFYLTYLVTKVPLALLVAFGFGLWVLYTERDGRGHTFLRVYLLFFLLPYSFVAGKFVRYMLPLFAVMDITAAIGIVWLRERVAARRSCGVQLLATGALSALFMAGPLHAAASSAPYFSLYQNPIGAALGPPGWLFPSDEFWDMGVREAMRTITAVSRRQAVVMSDAPSVVAYYAERYGRPDIESRSLSSDGFRVDAPETWVLAQDGHTYFENIETLQQIRRSTAPFRTIRIRGATAVEIFKYPR